MLKAILYFIAGVLCTILSWEAKRVYTEKRPRIVKSLRAAKSAWLEKE